MSFIFKVGSFNLINFVSNLIFIEINFCKPGVMQGLVLNFNFCVVSFFNGRYLSKIELNFFKKNIQMKNLFFFSDLMIAVQSTAE